MNNPFDQFDTSAADAGANPFDRFDAPIAQATNQSFFHSPQNAQEQAAAKSMYRTAVDYGLRGLTFGMGNKSANALGAVGASLVTGEPISDLYNEAANNQSVRMKSELQNNPGTAIGSELTGGLITGGALAGTAAGQAVANGVSRGLLPEASGLAEKGINLATKMGVSGVTGAASGALYGAGTADEGKMLEGAEHGAALSGGIGAALPVVGSALGTIKNAILPQASEYIKPLAEKALSYGIPLSRTQIGDSEAAKTIASAMGKVPLSGAAGFQKQQQEAFNREVLDTIGAKGSKATPELLSNTYKKIGNGFNQALSGQKVKITDDMVDRLAAITSSAKEELLPEHAGFIERQADRFTNLLNPDGTISGEKLGKLRSSFSRMSTKKDYPSEQLMALKNFVQDVSVEGAPERKEALQDAIEKFRHYQIIKPLLNKAVKGDISPSLLLSRVSGKSGFNDFAQGGGGKLGDLARIGQAFLKDPIPDSGTAQRNMAYKALESLGMGGAGYAAAGAPGIVGAVGIPIGLARGMNTLNTSQKLVRGALAPQISDGVNAALPSAMSIGQLSSYNRR